MATTRRRFAAQAIQRIQGGRQSIIALATRTPVLLALALATLGVLAWLDALSGTQLSLTPLYVIPVAVVAWYSGAVRARVCAVVAGTLQVIADLSGMGGAMPVGVIAWNALMIMSLSTVVGETVLRLHSSLHRERDLARTDPLTGVANGRSFRETANREIERARRYGRPFTVASLDLDHFKEVNDTLGHAAGDRLLHDIGRAINSRLRCVDSVARLGGDEFVMLFPETSAAPSLFVLEHIRRILGELTDTYPAGVRASIGAVTFSRAPDSVDELVKAADLAMYRAKARGRNRVETITLPEESYLLHEIETLLFTTPTPPGEAAIRPVLNNGPVATESAN
jgi:diguanylate cyclase (GGDEF)-like protein